MGRFSYNGKPTAFLKMTQPECISTQDPVKAVGKIPEVGADGRWTPLGFINNNNQRILTFDTSEGIWGVHRCDPA